MSRRNLDYKPPVKDTKPKVASGPAPPPPNLEKERKALFEAISSFSNIMKSSVLPENKSQGEKDSETAIAADAVSKAWAMNSANMDEGTMSMLTMLLHLTMKMRNDINMLKFQNLHLSKKIDKMKAENE